MSKLTKKTILLMGDRFVPKMDLYYFSDDISRHSAKIVRTYACITICYFKVTTKKSFMC